MSRWIPPFLLTALFSDDVVDFLHATVADERAVWSGDQPLDLLLDPVAERTSVAHTPCRGMPNRSSKKRPRDINQLAAAFATQLTHTSSAHHPLHNRLLLRFG